MAQATMECSVICFALMVGSLNLAHFACLQNKLISQITWQRLHFNNLKCPPSGREENYEYDDWFMIICKACWLKELECASYL